MDHLLITNHHSHHVYSFPFLLVKIVNSLFLNCLHSFIAMNLYFIYLSSLQAIMLLSLQTNQMISCHLYQSSHMTKVVLQAFHHLEIFPCLQIKFSKITYSHIPLLMKQLQKLIIDHTILAH